MYKPVSSWVILFTIGIFIVLGTSLPTALISMFISGVIPGTNYTMPLWATLMVYPFIGFTALLWIASQPIFIGESERPLIDPVVKKTSKPKKTTVALKQMTIKRRARSIT
ncbi:MAG: hypothetical protein ABIR46_02350 [Candidatus Saccharimonadales bacterium]